METFQADPLIFGPKLRLDIAIVDPIGRHLKASILQAQETVALGEVQGVADMQATDQFSPDIFDGRGEGLEQGQGQAFGCDVDTKWLIKLNTFSRIVDGKIDRQKPADPQAVCGRGIKSESAVQPPLSIIDPPIQGVKVKVVDFSPGQAGPPLQ